MAGAIGYARVSTDEQAKENNSLPAQEQRIASYCQQNGLSLLRVFHSSESARTMNRAGLTEMLTFCRDNRKQVSNLVITALSRLARSVRDQAQIIALLKQYGITVVSLDEPLSDDSAMGQLVRNMVGSFNQFFSDQLAEQTALRMRSGVQAGRFLWVAPIGYVNRNKKLQLDPVRAPLVRQAFELVTSGRYVTTDAVLKIVTALGLTTKKGPPIGKQTFSRMLRNALYAGWIVSGDLRVRGIHEPIISDEIFAAVQERINTKAVPHKKLNEDFPLRGVVRCSNCRELLTAGWSKGRKKRYAYYRCWNEECDAIKVRLDDLHTAFLSLLSRMEPTAELLAQLPERIATRYAERQKQIASQAARLNSRLIEQQTLNQKAVMAKLEGEISDTDFELFKEASDAEKSRINDELSTLNSEQSTMAELLRQAELDAVNLVAAWEAGNVNQRQELAKGFFPEGLVYSAERGFFEPANTIITEMLVRWIDDYVGIGVPDGI
jgi:site-specific DNA recombinase